MDRNFGSDLAWSLREGVSKKLREGNLSTFVLKPECTLNIWGASKHADGFIPPSEILVLGVIWDLGGLKVSQMILRGIQGRYPLPYRASTQWKFSFMGRNRNSENIFPMFQAGTWVR